MERRVRLSSKKTGKSSFIPDDAIEEEMMNFEKYATLPPLKIS